MFRINHLIIILICIAGTSCVRNTSYSLKETARVAINEDKHVFSDLPQKIQLVNDSAIAVLTDGQHLGVYSIRTGQCMASLDNTALDPASLCSMYMKKNRSRKTYRQTNTGESLQLSAFEYSNGRYYLFIDVPVLARYDTPMDFAKNERDLVTNNEKLQKLLESGEDLSFSVQETISFLVIAGNDLKIVSVLPFYGDIPALDKKYIFPSKNFHLQGSSMIMPVNHNIVSSFSDTITVGKAVGDLTLLASFSINGDSITYEKDVLTNRAIDISSMTTEDYMFAPYFYSGTDSGLVISNSMGVYHLNGTPFINYKPQQPKERIGNYKAEGDHVIYITQPGSAYHSPLKQSVTVLDSKSDKVLLRQELGNSKPMDIDIGNNIIVQVQQDKEHYYIATYALEEK